MTIKCTNEIVNYLISSVFFNYESYIQLYNFLSSQTNCSISRFFNNYGHLTSY